MQFTVKKVEPLESVPKDLVTLEAREHGQSGMLGQLIMSRNVLVVAIGPQAEEMDASWNFETTEYGQNVYTVTVVLPRGAANTGDTAEVAGREGVR